MVTQFHQNHVNVFRHFGNGTWTIGLFEFNNKAQCFTLEDAFQTEKIKGLTRIPAGLYELELKPIGSSRFDTAMWNKPPLRYCGMIRIKNVPGFEEILIHPGNSDEDTEGCVLVGLRSDLIAGTISASVHAYMKIYQPIADLLKKGEPVSIGFHDRDRPVEHKDLLVS